MPRKFVPAMIQPQRDVRTPDTASTNFSARPAWLWPVLLLIWCAVLCFAHDPRPLGAPRWAIQAVRSVAGISESKSMVVATVALRASGLAILGLLASLSLGRVPLKIAAPVVVFGAPLLAVLCQWFNYGHFPISMQLQLGIASALVGAIGGLALYRSWIAGGVLIGLLAGVYLWGTSTGISDDLARNARLTGEYLMDHADEVSDGDQGFADLLERAFLFADDNSHGTSAVKANKAAILALGFILGEERVARIAQRDMTFERTHEVSKLRQRVTLRGRSDLPRHFWVSAALVVLADENRAMTVGIGKELMDATGGGSGFSFVDLLANRAGMLLANTATQSDATARALHARVREGVLLDDFFPSIDELPEGFTMDEFQSQLGGLGGSETLRLKREIEERLSACRGLHNAS